jgi:hypothetical protein
MPQTAVRLFRAANGTVPLLDWLALLQEREQRAYVKCATSILLLAEKGHELRRPHADILRDGVYELRTRVGTVNYRILYFFCGKNMVCLSHGLTKEDKVPDAEIEEAVRRKRLVESYPDRYTALLEA